MPPKGGKETPIDPGLVGRLTGALAGALKGAAQGFSSGPAASFFGPGEPMAPQAPPEAKGRQFDYGFSQNIVSRPRAESSEAGGVSFATLRMMAQPSLGGLGLLRLAIETRKDQMAAQRWAVHPRDGAGEKSEARAKELNLALRRPDGVHNARSWQRMLVEDLLVLDAPTIYLRPVAKGPKILEVVDGATIKPLLNPFGRMPLPPLPAYQQSLKGIPATDYLATELVYAPRNPRPQSVYGYSPVEQVVDIIDFALRRAMSQMNYYREGNIPHTLVTAPKGWTPQQIEEFQTWFDTTVNGDLARDRKLKFIGDGATVTVLKEPELKQELDEWLARVICFAFNLSPQALVKETNRATAETSKEAAQEEGLEPLKLWFADTVNEALEKIGYPDLELKYEDEEIADALTKAKVFEIATGGKAWKSVAEARKAYGDPDLSEEELAALNPAPPPSPFGLLAGDMPPEDEPPTAGGNGAKKNGALPALAKAAKDGAAADDEAGRISRARRSLRPIDRERPAILKQRAALQKLTRRILKRQAKDVAAWVLDQAERVSRAARDDDDGLPQVIDSSDYEDDFADRHARVAKDGAKVALKQVSPAADEELLELLSQVNEKAVAWAEEHAAKLVVQIDETTREQVRDAVAKALEDGVSNQELAKSIVDLPAFSEERALLVARTETAYADVAGSILGWKESGVVARKRWITSKEEGICDVCDALDGVEVELEGQFETAGGDLIDGPPGHPACRCDCLPVGDEEEDAPA